MADGVQTIDPGYRRAAGAVKTGRLHKGHDIVAAHSSIPSKYQTVVVSNSDKRGFGGTSKRFNHDATVNENPGPGAYLRHSQAVQTNPSFSRKGYGVGFVSKEMRSKVQRRTVGPGSAAYVLPSLLSSRKDFNQSKASSSFHHPIAVRREKSSDEPAPNTYQVRDTLVHKHHGSQLQASFKSTSKRLDFNQNKSAAPAPGHYDVQDSLVKSAVKVPFSSFKSSTKRNMIQSPMNRRFKFPGYDYGHCLTIFPHLVLPTYVEYYMNPGPGQYHPHEEVDPVEKTLLPRKHYLCISAPAMPLPPPLPEPGPGSYELVDYRGPPKHYMSSAAFVSTTSRWTGSTTAPLDPGPATYQPFAGSGKQSFLYNSQRKWVYP